MKTGVEKFKWYLFGSMYVVAVVIDFPFFLAAVLTGTICDLLADLSGWAAIRRQRAREKMAILYADDRHDKSERPFGGVN